MLFPCFFCLINILHTLNSLWHGIICKGASLQLRESLSIIGGIFLTPSSLFFPFFFDSFFTVYHFHSVWREHTSTTVATRETGDYKMQDLETHHTPVAPKQTQRRQHFYSVIFTQDTIIMWFSWTTFLSVVRV